MSIVTDTLNRLQIERSRLTSQPESASSLPEELSESAPPSPEEPSLFSPPEVNHLTPQASSSVLRNGIRLVAILAVLGGIGLGAYVWGLSLVPEVAQFSLPPESIVESTAVGNGVAEESQPSEESPQSAVSDQIVQEGEEQDHIPSDELGSQPAELASVVPAEAAIPKEDPKSLTTQSVTAPTLAESGQPAAELDAEPAELASVVPAEATTSKEDPDEELATQSVTAPTLAESEQPAIEATPLVTKKEKPKLEPLSTAKPVPSSSDSRQARLSSPSENGVAPTISQPLPSRRSAGTDGSLETDKGSKRAQSPVTVPPSATSSAAKLVRAQDLIKQQQYGQAVTSLQPLFVKPPDRWEPWFWLGTAQLGLGQLEEAEESFVEGLARDATVPQLCVQRALVSQQQGKFGEAVEALRQAELIAPQLPEVQLNLAYSLEVQGHIEPAVDHYHTFLALTEGNPAYYPARRKVLERVIRLEKT